MFLPNLVSLLVTFLSIYNIFAERSMYWIVGELVVALTVYMMKYYFNGKGDIFKRPNQARNCNIINRGGDCSAQCGFPSGHVAHITFSIMSIILHSQNSDLLYSCLFLFLIVWVGWARVEKHCHNKQQVKAGVLVGVAIALLFKVIFNAIN